MGSKKQTNEQKFTEYTYVLLIAQVFDWFHTELISWDGPLGSASSSLNTVGIVTKSSSSSLVVTGSLAIELLSNLTLFSSVEVGTRV
jgi:hypothetical protein